MLLKILLLLQATHFAWIHCHMDCIIHLRIEEIVSHALRCAFRFIPNSGATTQAEGRLFWSTFFKNNFALLFIQNHLYVDVGAQSDSGYTMFVQD